MLFETKWWIFKQEEINFYEELSFMKWEEIIEDNFEKEINTYYLLDLHKELFWNLYSWAWNIRNIEVSFWWKEWVPYYLIRQELEKLFWDINFRIKNKDDIIEVITEFEYRFICIHPFINTNWRMSRLLTYQIILQYWYRWKPNVYDNRNKRERYLNAMKEFDMWNKEELKQIIKEYLTNFTLIWVN